MKKELSKELEGQRVTFGETDDQNQKLHTDQRRAGRAVHNPGHYEVVPSTLTEAGKHVLPILRQKPYSD